MAKASKNKNNFLDNLGAYGVGLTNLPVDVFRYSGLAGNLALNGIGLRDDKTAKEVADWFQNVKNPLDRKGYQQTNPEMYKLGEIVGETLGLAKAVNLAKGAAKHLPKYNASAFLPAIQKAAVIEAAVEPGLDAVTRY